LAFAQRQTFSCLDNFEPTLGYCRNYLDPLEFAHIHRDETTLIHDRLLNDTLCQRAPEAENRTSLISQNRTFLKSLNPDI
jgi:hypothetical protein